jgi:hypothetical protein
MDEQIEDQGAVVVGVIPRKIKGKRGLKRVPDGLPEDRLQFDLSKYFKVINHQPSIVDEDWNEKIQREGAYFH